MCHCCSLLVVKTRFPRRLRCKEDEEEEGGGVAEEAWKEMSKLLISGEDMYGPPEKLTA